MKLFVLRHGKAEHHLGPDESRALTDSGTADVRAMVQQHLPALQAVTAIYASPYKRAQQTAALASELLNLPVVTCETLTPDTDVNELASFCEKLSQETPLLVSHQPLVGTFVDWLAGLEPGRYIMGTSALAALETEVVARGCGDLLWLRQPGDSV